MPSDKYRPRCLCFISVVIMSAMASQITSLMIVYSTVYSGAYQRKHQSSASLAFVRGIHRWPVNSPHKWPVTPKMFPFDDVITWTWQGLNLIVLTVEWSFSPSWWWKVVTSMTYHYQRIVQRCIISKRKKINKIPRPANFDERVLVNYSNSSELGNNRIVYMPIWPP